MNKSSRRFVIGAVALHTLLLACYTFPEQLVPERLRVMGQFYARPVFHQQWRLFAPDPPLCSCELQMAIGNEHWRPITRQDDGFLDRRIAQSIARNIQRALGEVEQQPDPRMLASMRLMVRDILRERQNLRFRLVEHCVTDPRRPIDREARITPIQSE
jgi:hypothetical protein